MFKVNNKVSRPTPGVFIVNFEHISHFVLLFLLLALSRSMPAGYTEKYGSEKALVLACFTNWLLHFKVQEPPNHSLLTHHVYRSPFIYTDTLIPLNCRAIIN